MVPIVFFTATSAIEHLAGLRLWIAAGGRRRFHQRRLLDFVTYASLEHAGSLERIAPHVAIRLQWRREKRFLPSVQYPNSCATVRHKPMRSAACNMFFVTLPSRFLSLWCFNLFEMISSLWCCSKTSQRNTHLLRFSVTDVGVCDTPSRKILFAIVVFDAVLIASNVIFTWV